MEPNNFRQWIIERGSISYLAVLMFQSVKQSEVYSSSLLLKVR